MCYTYKSSVMTYDVMKTRFYYPKSSPTSSKSGVREHSVRSGTTIIDWARVKMFERKLKEFSRRVLEATKI